MANIKTHALLPSIFQTKTNEKFLNATLDQLVSQPDLRKINAYVGRTFAPTYNSGDNYQPEPNNLRQRYQLEPSVVVKSESGNVNLFSSYIDLVERIQSYGGITDNHSKLFSSETYSYDGLFDYDKLVNFNQYYWLPNGPDVVRVFGNEISFDQTYTVARDENTGSYFFSGFGNSGNPIVKLAHGGVYRFEVNQPGHPFWIQFAPGISGTKETQPNISTRTVLGVENNGIDVGTITFRVPQSTAQDQYLNMPVVANVDYATGLRYTDVQNKTLDSIRALGGFDGVTGNLLNKTIIFLNEDIDSLFWTANTLEDLYGFTDPTLYNTRTVPESDRRGTWSIKIVDTPDGEVVHLIPAVPVQFNQRVLIRSGLTLSETQYYIDQVEQFYVKVPEITAPLPVLYYQDGSDSRIAGAFSILESEDKFIDVDSEILGRSSYTSPNGIEFTNGLRIQFDSFVTPESYSNNIYYVEGVGSSIRLVAESDLIAPESYASELTAPDYFTISRESIDLNPWSRSNRWFHVDVITKTAEYNSLPAQIDQTKRANRPIIEFDPDLQLFNSGRVSKSPIDIIDFDIDDAFSTVELQDTYLLDGVYLEDGQRVVFAADTDPLVRNKIYVVNIEEIEGNRAIHLTLADDADIFEGNSVIVLDGSSQGKVYHYDGSEWLLSQQKTSVNQYPLFDIVDTSGVSFGEYDGSTFTGTKIFSYQVGTGVDDPVLGFPLSYRNFGQIGDILFKNDYDVDVAEYTSGTLVINQGALKVNKSLSEYSVRNIWQTNREDSIQYQIIHSEITDSSRVRIDVLPKDAAEIPYLKVYKNSKILSSSEYSVVQDGALYFVELGNAVSGDLIDILINSSDVSELGYFQIPQNLEFNSENQTFESMTLGQLRNHLITLAENSRRVSGPVPGSSNIRDIDLKKQGGSIVQHSAPVIYSELFLVDKDANFIKSLDFAAREYSKIKNKFLELAANMPGIDYTDPVASTDAILKKINAFKNKQFPWYYSDMVPYGDVTNRIEYTIFDAQIRGYEISEIFNDTEIGSKAILVYLNNKQLTKGYDFVFDTFRSGITLLDSLTVSAGDQLVILEYDTTDGCYIPETPTKLGLYPKFKPEKFLDETYQTPIEVIRGHDGSITPAFGDYRDEFLLELEKRIYNNIKLDDSKNSFDFYDYVPGRFRATDYTLEEFNSMISSSFMSWVGTNRVNFSNNEFYQNSNPWTWNYKRFYDTVGGERLPGAWRAIYNYFYDTIRPNITPWEMLGFTEEPDWWQERYGPAPYTAGNLVLWQDLSRGYIHAGPRAGVDPRFARPGLLNIIPVDDRGVLRSPESFAVLGFDGGQTDISFAIGDQGPVESAWRSSSFYPFALQRAIALSKPAFYFGTLMNVGRYYKNSSFDQYVLKDKLSRITPSDVRLNGNTNGTEVTRSSGYINWIIDYLTSVGKDPYVTLSNMLGGCSVQLAYKMAGFSDKTMLQVIAEQSSPTSTNQGVIIPEENYRLFVSKSTPVDTIVYSAVIVEQTSNGYTVSGYDTESPYFMIIPSKANNNAYDITVGTETAVIYKDFQNYQVRVPYGYEFTNKQQLVDFLVSYERYLISKGLVFDYFDTDLQAQRDFKLSAREFLSWVQQGWQPGTVLVLGPLLNDVQIQTDTGVIDKIVNSPGESRAIDVSYNYLKSNQSSVYRLGNRFNLVANYGQTIGLLVVDVVEYEHALIFDNRTVFDDVIYAPELGERQYRLKLVGQKTGSWTGELSPNGFILNSDPVPEWIPNTDYAKGSLVQYKNIYYTALVEAIGSQEFEISKWAVVPRDKIKTGMLPNFSYNASKYNRFFDVDNPEMLKDFEDFSSAAIGFRPRQYMTDFGLDKTTQVKFYQGFVKEKGTRSAIEAFTAAGSNSVTSDIDLYEEWAFRVGEYGALENNKFVEVLLNESTFTSDPVQFELLANSQATTDRIPGFYPHEVYKKSLGYDPKIYQERGPDTNYSNDLKSAGYVNENDVDYTIFNMANYSELNRYLSTVGIGSKIWCARDLLGDWNVYRVTDLRTQIREFSLTVDNIAVVTTSRIHSFRPGDLLLIKGLDSRLDGFYQVYAVDSATKFRVVLYQDSSIIGDIQTITRLAPVYKLQSVRIKRPTDINKLILGGRSWEDGDKLWVDSSVNGSWLVYNKTTPWNGDTSALRTSMALPNEEAVSNSGYGASTTISPNEQFTAAGMPNVIAGQVAVYLNNNGNYDFSEIITTSDPVTNFGFSLDSTDDSLFVGAPGDELVSVGAVYVYSFNGSNMSLAQTILSPDSAPGDSFGYSIAVSTNEKWMYVSAPKIGKVYVYANLSGNWSHHDTIDGTSYTGWIWTNRFGESVKTNSTGSHFVVAAPYETVDGNVGAGAVYSYVRSIESFIASGNSLFTTQHPLGSVKSVFVEKQLIESGINFTLNEVIFDNAPEIGDLVEVETNAILLLEKTTASAPVFNGFFGQSVHLSDDYKDIFVSSPGYTDNVYSGGLIYRFANNGQRYATVESTVFEPEVTIGNSFRINGHLIEFTGTGLSDVLSDIQSANIPGITAEITDYGTLRITSSAVNGYILSITPGNSNQALLELGLTVFSESQTIKHDPNDRVERFGESIVCSESGDTFVVSGGGGTNYDRWSLDGSDTYFDAGSTDFLDSVENSGSVYVFGRVQGSLTVNSEDQYVLIQSLENKNVKKNDQFGKSIALSGQTLVVGSPGDDSAVTQDEESEQLTDMINSGAFYVYTNESGLIGWDVLRQDASRVDIDSVSRIYLYDVDKQHVIANLDFIDPNKGKVLGAALQDLDYITEYDPATYNTAGTSDNELNSTSVNFNNPWGKNQVGQLWWNTSKVRFIDYEQGSLLYRASNWAKQFSGSDIEVSEWIVSDRRPSEYRGTGEPLYEDDSSYVVENYVDPASKIIRSRYYFWVKNKETKEVNSTKKSTAFGVAGLIRSPEAQGIPYAAITSVNSIALYGVGSFLDGRKIAVHLDYDTEKNTNIIHSEYKLIQEGSDTNEIPIRFVNKLRDSLSGIDVSGSPIPSTILSVQDQIGVEPKQSLFVNRLSALGQWRSYINTVMQSVPVADDFVIDGLYSAEPLPAIDQYDITVDTVEELGYIDTTDLPSGYVVLVLQDSTVSGIWSLYEFDGAEFTQTRIQENYTPFYWNLVDWIKPGFDSSTRTTFTVATINDIQSLSLSEGNTVLVRNNGTNRFQILEYTNSVLNTVGIQNGTVQINERIFEDTAEARQAIRTLFDVIRDSIFVESLSNRFNELFFYMVNYILTEQKSVDWIFKTSFISVVHKLRKLEAFPNFIRDPQDYYEGYINEVKPYRTSIRQYLLDYQGQDDYKHDITDFDVPSAYDSIIGQFRTPDSRLATDFEILSTNPLYKNWFENYGYSINEVKVTRTDSGSTTQITVLNLFTDYEVPVYADEVVTQLETASIELDTNVIVYVGNVISQPASGASGVVAKDNTGGNVVLLTDLVGSFSTTGNARIEQDGVLLNSNVSAVSALSSGANGVVYVDSLTSSITLVNTDGEFTTSPIAYLYLRNPNGSLGSNIGYTVNSVSQFAESTGYFEEPLVIVEGGGGTGANIRAILDPFTNSIDRFEVINPGTGYTSTPTIRIEGTGGGAGGYPVLVGQHHIDTIYVLELGLDSNLSVNVGDIIFQPNTVSSGQVYSLGNNQVVVSEVNGSFNVNDYIFTADANTGVSVTTVVSSIRFDNASYPKIRTFTVDMKYDRTGASKPVVSTLTLTGNLTIEPGDEVVQLTEYTANSVVINDTIEDTAVVGSSEAAYVINTESQSGNVLVFTGISGQFAVGSGNIWINGVDTGETVASVSDTGSKGSYYSSDIVEWSPNESYSAGTIVSRNGQAWRAISDVRNSKLLKLSGNISLNSGDVITQLGSDAIAAVESLQVSDLVTVFDVDGDFTRRRGNILINAIDSGVYPTVITDVFDQTQYELLDTAEFDNANDRIMAAYFPSIGMPKKELSRLIYGIEYPGTEVKGVEFDQVSDVTGNTGVLSYNSIFNTISSSDVQVVDFTTKGYEVGDALLVKNYTWLIVNLSGIISITDSDYITQVGNPNVNVSTTATSIEGNRIPFTAEDGALFVVGANIEINGSDSGVTVESTNVPVLKTQILDIQPDILRVVAQSDSCLNLVECPFTSNLTLEYYDFRDYSNLDSIIQSNYADTALGTRPEDINIDGGAYYDIYSSHAPEEMMPGIIFDNLNISVYTKIQNNTSVIGYRIEHNMQSNSSATDANLWPKYYRISSANVTVLTEELSVTDSLIHVDDASVLSPPNKLLAIPGVVYINGEKIHYYEKDNITNTLGQIRRAVDGTGAPSVHPVGSQVEDSNKANQLPGQLITTSIGEHAHKTTWLSPSGESFFDYLVTEFGDQLIDEFSNEFTTSVSGNVAITNGSGLEGSIMPQAAFIRGEF